MIHRSILGIFILSLWAPFLWGQEYFPSLGQPSAPVTTYPRQLPPVSLNAPAPYFPPTTPYAPGAPSPSPQLPTLQPSTPVPYTPSYPITSQSAVPQITPSAPPYGAAYTAPYAPPYAAPYTAPYAAPHNAAPSAPPITAPPQLALPEVAPPIPPVEQTPTAESDTAKSDTTEPATEEEVADELIEEPLLVEVEPPKAWYYAPIDWFDLWEGNIELGMSGSNGNSETINYLLGLDAKRETEWHVLDFDLKYDRKSANSIETAHRLFGEIRWELLFEDSSWTWFFHETTEYDEFTAYDVRLSYDTGLGRCLIKDDDTSLLARAGAGLSHEIGSPKDDMVPEAVFGLEFDHKLNERQKFSASSEYSPDVTDFLDYRLKSRASWEVLLDEDTNLSLKVSILNRYDSTPHGKKPNDLDYTLTLLWSF